MADNPKRRTFIAIEQLGEPGGRITPPSAALTRPRKDTPTESSSSSTNRFFGSNALRKRTAISSSHQQELQLPKVTEAGVRAYDYVVLKEDCPWKYFERVYRLKFQTYITIAQRKSTPCEVVTVKEMSLENTKHEIDMLQRIRHVNFVAFLDCFAFRGRTYAVLEYVSISLAEIIACPLFPTERQLAAIVGQTLAGLKFLASKCLWHGSLTATNVFLDHAGVIKISDQNGCRRLIGTEHEHEDVRAIGRLTMELMQKYCKEDGAIGVEDLHRWPSDSPSVSFLSCTTSAASVTELSRHPLMMTMWQPENLRALVALAAVSVNRRYQMYERGPD